MFKLVIQDDEGKTTVVPLIRDEITIGRKEGNTIRLTERNVSRRHARILRNNGEVQIEDLGSYNGIRVNNARIAERVSLRISDQVQIGDYKLYLKAEGVEQVDDARTMPIERVDNGAATEVMPAVTPPPATAPMAAPAAPAAPAIPAAPMRTPAATADTDPGGRPVATPAQVAALNQTATYGKLVVVSSNFARKEFDLTRPQMIVGRTDENDIVINHRSISRNHAKITRDPETGRYSISDLQSANGVRVNGQDYGKVELRRGDVVDLGHVRLRFVEPGEDFVFSRDAVITDVPETGGKKGMLVAVILAIVVLGGVGAFLAMKGGGKTSGGSNGSSGMVASGGSDDIASGDSANHDVTNPDNGGPTNPDNGSGSGTVAVAPPADAAETTPPGDEKDRINLECLNFQADKKWTDLNSCADRLAKYDKAAAKALKEKVKTELGNEIAIGKLQDAAKDGNLKAARKIRDSIGEDSLYRKDAETIYQAAEKKVIDQFRDQGLAYKRRHDCAALDKLVQQASAQGSEVADAIRGIKCEVVAEHHPSGGNNGGNNGGSQQPSNCDAEDLKDKGMAYEAQGQHGAALASFEAALRCKPDARGVQLAFMASCNLGNASKARVYYNKLSPDAKSRFAVMCIRNHITKETLEGK